MKKKLIIIIIVLCIVLAGLGFFHFILPGILRVNYCKKTYGKEFSKAEKCEVRGFKCINPKTNEEVHENCLTNDVLKPIIYIYPKEKTNINVKLGYPDKITHSYPKYTNGWNVIANTDGLLYDIDNNRNLYSLYYENVNTVDFDFDDGFVVEGKDTAKFLEEKLSLLGLNDLEIEEFIIYWLPKLENNKYNQIRFASIDEINDNMPLYFSKNPDSLIRVLMIYKKLDNYKNIKEQELITPKRNGFVIVEWGGVEIN